MNSHRLVGSGEANEVHTGKRAADLLHAAPGSEVAEIDDEEARVLEPSLTPWKQPEAIVVDANGLTFIDSSGLAALLRSRATAGVAGVGVRISERSPALRRAIDAAGIEYR
jgi:anti-anti-sigma factor